MPGENPHGATIVRIAEGRANSLSKCTNRTISWLDFGAGLKKPRKDRESLKQFALLPAEEQGRMKAADGWVVGGLVAGGKRSNLNVSSRDILAFDLDECEPSVLESLLDGSSPACRYEWFLHSTRKHTPEAPRVRLYVLAADPVPREVFEPVSRIVGAMVDPTLDGIDEVSFRAAQLMYRPTICRDSVWVFHHNEGEAIDADEVLEGFEGDWRDFATLPHSDKRSKARRRAEKSEDPTEKKGIVGSFCRAYTVPEAIEAFIPEVYTEGDTSGANPRYTFAEGSVANGAIVYDDGLFLYSNHDTDPAGHQNCNAFDLVRIHKFGHEDKNTDTESESVTKWPSFKAMADFSSTQQPVREEIVRDRYDLESMLEDLDDEDERTQALAAEAEEDVDDVIAQLLAPSEDSYLPRVNRRKRPKKPAKGWGTRKLEFDEKNFYKQTLHNAAIIIANDPRLWGCVGFNGFSGKITARATIKSKIETVRPIEVRDRENGEPWLDYMDYSVRAILEAPPKPQDGGAPGWGYKISDRDLRQAIRLVSEQWWFHPVMEYLEGLTWDGVPRVETMAIDYLGLPDTCYARDTSRLSLLAVVARVYCPGHKWDHVPILSGPQGIRKSSFIKTLFGERWAGELTAEMASNKDAVEQMLGKLCLELPELAHMRRGDVNSVKEFITLTVDRVRLAYDARVTDFRRQCVFWGTSNESDYLKDRTGNRRFWPWTVEVSQIDTDRLAANRDQLWAEAYHLWKEACRNNHWSDLPLYLTGKSAEIATALQNQAREEDSVDATASVMEEWLNTPVRLSAFRDGDATDFDDEDDPWVLRVVTTPREAYCGSLGLSSTDMARDKRLDLYAGEAMQAVPSFVRGGIRVRRPLYGRGHQYHREDSTHFERKVGYRLIEQPEDIL